MIQRVPTALALAAASSAPGAIVIFDIPDLIVSDGQLGYNGVRIDSFNISNGAFASSTFSTAQFQPLPSSGSFSVGTYNPGYDGGRVFVGYGTDSPVMSGFVNGTLFPLLSPASIVSSATVSFTNQITFDPNSDPGAGTRYMGLRWTDAGGSGLDHYGWFEVSYGARIAGVRTYTFTRFAFEGLAGQPITTPAAVPEASTLGLVGGLFGLVAAAHVRRRKAKQAAASDKFLALAAGEKLN